MFLYNGLYLRNDNSVIGDLNRENILCSSRNFTVSNLSNNDTISEFLPGIGYIEDTYGSINGFIENVYNRAKNYTILAEPSIYAMIFSGFIKSFYASYDVNEVYKLYKLFTYRDNSLSMVLDHTYNLKGIDGFVNVGQYDLFLREPLEKDAFKTIFNQATAVPVWANKPVTKIGVEFLLMNYLKGRPSPELKGACEYKIRMIILSNIVDAIARSRKEIFLQANPKIFEDSVCGEEILEPINYYKTHPEYDILTDAMFRVSNIQYCIDAYPIRNLREYYLRIVDAVYDNQFQHDVLNALFDALEADEIEKIINVIIPQLSNILLADGYFMMKINGLLVNYIYQKKSESKNHFVESFVLRS